MTYVEALRWWQDLLPPCLLTSCELLEDAEKNNSQDKLAAEYYYKGLFCGNFWLTVKHLQLLKQEWLLTLLDAFAANIFAGLNSSVSDTIKSQLCLYFPIQFIELIEEHATGTESDQPQTIH